MTPGERLPCIGHSEAYDQIIDVQPSSGGRGQPPWWAIEEAGGLCCDCPFFAACVLGEHKDEFWAHLMVGVRRRRTRQRLAS